MKRLFSSQYEQGQSLVEVSLGLIVLFFIVAGLIDLGRAYFVIIALEDSAGEGAVFLSINPDCRTAADGAECADPNNADYRARNAVNGEINWENAVITLERPDAYGVGETVKVEVEYEMVLVTPVISQMVGGGTIKLSSEATQIIISETVASAPSGS
jgi:hypothetical protein